MKSLQSLMQKQLQQGEKNKESLKIANDALKLAPNNERILYVKLIGLINLNNLSS